MTNVIVTQGIQVVHDGQVYRDGESLDVPERVARQWESWGWVGLDRLPDSRGLTNGPLPHIAASDDEITQRLTEDDPDDEPEPEPKPRAKAQARARRDPRRKRDADQ